MASAEQAFARFQETGDPRDLGLVFDETAAELFSVATHLVGDPHLAEDLLQTTFLMAIEDRAQFRGQSSVLAWLLGILTNRVRDARRQASRQPDPERLPEKRSLGPRESAEGSELTRAVSDAIRGLPEPYRPVLSLHLRHGLNAHDIALALGRPPGTLRTQLVRGMELLRRALPPGLIGGTLAVFSPARGLAAVRAAVVKRAVPPPLRVAGAWIGGMAMKKTLWILSACLVAGLSWISWPRAEAGGVQPPAASPAGTLTSDPFAEAPAHGVAQREPDSRQPLGSAPAFPDPGGSRELLAGTVVTARGAPVADAEVTLQQRDAQGFRFPDPDYQFEAEDLAAQRTGADGTFAFPVPAQRPFRLEVRHAGHATTRIPDCYGGQDRTVVLQAGAAIEGLVTRSDDGSPLGGTQVWVVPAVPPDSPARITDVWAAARTATDARGLYHIGDLPPGGLEIALIPPWGAVPDRMTFELGAGQIRRHDIEVESTNPVTGTVTDAGNGQPIPGAEVSDEPLFMRSVRADIEGKYTLHGVGAVLLVRAKGYGLSGHLLDAVSGTRTVDVALVPGGAAEGRIVDGQGRAVPGAYVAAVTGYTGRLGHFFDWRAVRSGSEGRFRIEDLHPDLEYHVLVRQPGFGMVLYAFPSSVRPGDTTELGDLSLPVASIVRGRVVDQAGQGMSGISIALSGSNSDRLRLLDGERKPRLPEWAERQAVSDEEGVFRIVDLAPGTYTLRAETGQYSPGRTSMPVTIAQPGAVLEDLEIVFDMSLEISGRVRTPTGEPPGDLVVVLESQDRSDEAENAVLLENGETTFRFVGVRPGTYAVGAVTSLGSDRPWIHGRTRDVEAGSTDVDVVLRRAAWIEGVVLDTAGEPAEGITVRTAMPDAVTGFRTARLRTGPDGTFRLEVGEGETVEVHAGPPPQLDAPRGAILNPDPERVVVVPGISAGTTGLVIRLR